eukprot:TRINITY_DN40756_c0_g1_i1.p1 TRINITY_DN40756_c0_g1~~TRINITY_DN40756_c0_g1_i1.p1  ORF type:complete len:293 (-),score=33.94 TRINITY_DN40756_c0_g1_i1:79-957(-)
MAQDIVGMLCCGPVEVADINVDVVPGCKEYSEAVVAGSDKHWSELIAKKPHCFDGPVWGVVDSEAIDEVIETVHSRSRVTTDTACATTAAVRSSFRRRMLLRLQLSSYRFASYTHFTEEGKLLPQHERCNVVGVGCLTFTKEGLLMIGRRSEHVGMLPGYWSVLPVGVVDGPNLTDVLAKEAKEELDLDLQTDAQDCWALGLIDAGEEQGNCTNFIFVLHLHLTAKEVRARYDTAMDKAEHSQVLALHPSEVAGLHPVTEILTRAVSAWQRLRTVRNTELGEGIVHDLVSTK